MSGRIPREMSPCPSLVARNGSDKNCALSPVLIPKSSSSSESPSRMSNLFPPISPTPPRSWICTISSTSSRIIELINELGSAGVTLDLEEVARSSFHISLNDDSVPCSETRCPDEVVGLGRFGPSAGQGYGLDSGFLCLPVVICRNFLPLGGKNGR